MEAPDTWHSYFSQISLTTLSNIKRCTSAIYQRRHKRAFPCHTVFFSKTLTKAKCLSEIQSSSSRLFLGKVKQFLCTWEECCYIFTFLDKIILRGSLASQQQARLLTGLLVTKPQKLRLMHGASFLAKRWYILKDSILAFMPEWVTRVPTHWSLSCSSWSHFTTQRSPFSTCAMDIMGKVEKHRLTKRFSSF